MSEWVIASTIEPHLYWSNSDGWGSLATATVFADGERPVLGLPLDGKWVEY